MGKYSDGSIDHDDNGDYCRFDEVEPIIIKLEQEILELIQFIYIIRDSNENDIECIDTFISKYPKGAL